MKYPIELNGIANLHILTDSMEEEHGHNGQLDYAHEKWASVREQLELLERYMIAYTMAVNNGTPVPYWHEIRENPEKYPLHKDIK